MSQCRVVCLLAVCSLVFSPAMADMAALSPDPGIPLQIKQDTSASEHADDILQQIHGEMLKMEQNPADQPTVSMVRQWLIDEMQIAGNPTDTTPDYKETYTKALNKEFLDALGKPDCPVAVRLNIGLVIAQLPGRAVNLQPTVCKLLLDPSAVVADCGERAAEAILPLGLVNNGMPPADRDQLLDDIIKAVANHPEPPMGGSVAEDAYRAINPCFTQSGWPQNLFPQGDGLAALIGTNLKLQAARLQIYINTGIPESPRSDTLASYFLFGSQKSAPVWDAMNSDQRTQAEQQASDLISLAAQRAQGRPANENEELIDAIRYEGTWLNQLTDVILKLEDRTVTQATQAVAKLERSTPANDILKTCQALAPALQANNAFALLKLPIDLSAPKSASGGTTQSSTSVARP